MKVFKYALLVLIAITSINMGGGEEATVAPYSNYMELDKDAPSFVANVYANGKATKVKDLNFGGKAIITGMRKEGQKGTIDRDLADINTITIEDSNYYSGDGNEWVRLSYTAKDGVTVSGFLLSRKIAVSGLGMDPGELNSRYGWVLSEIKKIELLHSDSAEMRAQKIRGEK